MSPKNKKNILTLIFALLIAMSLILATMQHFGAALGLGFFALLIWSNKLRKGNNTESNNNIEN